jgi:hypothetical protein
MQSTVHGRGDEPLPQPQVRVLECGVGWAVTLYSDLIGHWEKRNIKPMANYDPANDKREIKDRFVPHFYFGCEADDPITARAFDTKKNPYGAKLNAIFNSDIGHWLGCSGYARCDGGSIRAGRTWLAE